jgi:hypothetical protein
MGFIAGPLRPPTTFARRGFATSGTMAIARMVLMAVMPSAPPSAAASARGSISAAMGDSFANTERPPSS